MHSVNTKNQSIFVLLSSRSMSIIRRGTKERSDSNGTKTKRTFSRKRFRENRSRLWNKKEDIISFSANVNPLGVSFRLKETLTNHIDAITTYPDREYTSLRKCIADYVHTNYENIVVGNGSTELISLFIQITHPMKALIVYPTYSEYEREVAMGGGRSHYFSLTEASEFELDTKALTEELSANVDLLILCNPNNPTSSVIKRQQMREILDYCKRKSITVLVDETYVEFAEEPEEVTAIPLTEYYNNIVILRGISKFFAAPGLRLGYAICGNRDLLNEINQKKNPWTINSLAAIAGEIMFQDEDYIKKTRELISSERARICARLDESPNFKVYHAHANFVLVKLRPINLLRRTHLTPAYAKI